MPHWSVWLLVGIPAAFLLFLAFATVCACMLSSRISREEEHERFEEYLARCRELETVDHA